MLHKDLTLSIWRRINARIVSFETLRLQIYIVSSVDKTEVILLYFPTGAAPQFIENLAILFISL